LFHFVTLLPFTLFVELDPVWRHLYLIKVLRTFSAMKVFDVSKIFHNIKEFTRNQTIQRIERDPMFGEDTTNDHNQVENLLLAKFLLRTLKVIIIILNFSYFLGLSWLIICAGDLWFIEYLNSIVASHETHKTYDYF